jgi:hypothetical protein
MGKIKKLILAPDWLLGCSSSPQFISLIRIEKRQRGCLLRLYFSSISTSIADMVFITKMLIFFLFIL